MPGRGRRLVLASSLWMLAAVLPLAAFDLAGIAPETVFAGEGPNYYLELLNDSNAFSTNRVETDDIRSFGIEAYGSWRGLALGVDYEGFTFRGDPPEDPSRNDELALSAAWMGSPLGGRDVDLRFGLGGGLRAWGDFGFEGVQRFWHGFLGVRRPFPSSYDGSQVLPFAYVSSIGRLAVAGPLSAKSVVHLLAVAPGGLESSLGLFAEERSRASETFAGIRRQDRFGSFSACDEKANDYEAGTWIVWGARTGLLSVENASNACAAFSLGTMSCRIGANDEAEASGPRQELSIGIVPAWASFALSRFLVFDSNPEVHAGFEAFMGLSRKERGEDGTSRYEEGLLAIEAYLRDARCLRPFAGLAGGLRQDVWTITDLQRSILIARRVYMVGEIYGGVRLLELSFDRRADGGAALDIGGTIAFTGGGFLPPEPGLFLRVSATDPR